MGHSNGWSPSKVTGKKVSLYIQQSSVSVLVRTPAVHEGQGKDAPAFLKIWSLEACVDRAYPTNKLNIYDWAVDTSVILKLQVSMTPPLPTSVPMMSA